MALAIKDLYYAYNGYSVLEKFSADFPAGTFSCITGPSGCGKSTLLKLIAGLLKPAQGEITLSGEPVNCSQGDVGFLFQENSLFPWMTIIKNVEFGLKLKGETPKIRQEKAAHYLNLVGLADNAHFFPHQLSGGMKQRAALARMLAYEPKLLLMDEPFASLDAQTRNLLQVELERIWLREKKTVLFVTHSIDEAVFLADLVVVLTRRPAKIKEVTQIDFPRTRKRTGRDFVQVREYLLSKLDQNTGSYTIC
jgi:NitT/TauT family transport system ATP-binding protein